MDIDSSASSLHARASVRRQGSAVEKVWRTAELATHILSYLVRERIDLIVCSTVSKYFRALALPLLVQTLDVPITKAGLTLYFFESNPTLADFIKYIRIWENRPGRFNPKTPDGSICVYDTEEERDPEWMKIADLVGLILKGQTTAQLPLLDVTVSLASMSTFNNAMLRQNRQAAQRIVALDIVPSPMRDMDDFTDNAEQYPVYTELFTMRWRQLGLFVTEMCSASANANPPALKRFEIGGKGYYAWYADAEFWHCLKRALPATVEDLVLELPPAESDFSRAAVLLATEWPHLRASNFALDTHDGGWVSRIDQFFARHQHLENIEITSIDYGPEITIPNTDLAVPDTSSLVRSSLTLPHATLEKVALGEDALRLDVLRASSRVAALLVRNGVTVRHYEFDYVSSIKELRLDEWLFPVREAAEAVTCLDIEVRFDDVRTESDSGGDDTRILQASFLPADALPAGALPNLTELVLCWGDCGSQNLLSTADGEALLAGALATLKHQKSLRHLRLEHADGMPFPSLPNIIEVEDNDPIPPQLEYITWHSAYKDCTQRYRVVLPVQLGLATDVTVEGIGTRRPPLKIRLQRLPNMVGSRIDERGVWDRPQGWGNGTSMFDHSKSPPELYV
ncbi:hypothetical protein A4X13_0g6774 [Tilletia indica]|uniref:F-box domain-containing protein n=1 Tax=Tilletia indica TaxID=43049 RepID=A0A8T8SNR3_9BASI|nr:hypothetical protein A4X13_0g6774 [Tilletia indica]